MIKKYSIAFIFSILTVALFWQFFFKGLYPFPGNFLLAWHEPYRSDYFVDNKILLPHKPIADDVFRQIYPFRILAIDMIKNLEPPLWNPYNGAGMPLLATLNIGFLDPFNILFILFPYSSTWSLYIIIQFFLIGLFTYIYCRRIKLTTSSSIFSAFVFSLSGFVATRLVFLDYGLAIALIPLTLFLIESYVQNPKSKLIFFLPFVIFSLIVSTQPQISLYILFFSFVYAVFRFLNAKNKYISAKHYLLLFILTVLGIGMAGVQIFPTMELLGQSNIDKNASLFVINKFLVPIQHLVSVFIPNYFGNEATYNFWGYGNYIQTIAYVGTIPLFFAYFALFSKKKASVDLRLFYLIATLVTISIALDWAFSQFVTSLPLPILSTGAPSRIFLLTTFSLSILAGYGFANWENYKERILLFISKSMPYLIVILCIFAVTFILLKIDFPCRFGVVQDCRTVAFRNTVLEVSGFALFIIPLIVNLIFKNKFIKNLSLISIFLIISSLGIYNANKTIDFSPKESIFPENDLALALAQKTKDGRVFGIDQATIPTNFATQFRFYDPQYYHPLYIQRYRELIEFANNGKYTGSLPRGDVQIKNFINPNPELHVRRQKLFNLLGVNYLIFKKNQLPDEFIDSEAIWENNVFKVIGNKNALPRVYIVDNFLLEKDNEIILTKLFADSFNYKNYTILEEKPNYKNTELNLDYKIHVLDNKENYLAINSITNKDALLVLLDNYYPGWKAFIDGKETKIYRANYTFRAIELPAGNHMVKFSYEPNSFKIGLVLSVFSIVIYATTVVFIKRLNQKNND